MKCIMYTMTLTCFKENHIEYCDFNDEMCRIQYVLNRIIAWKTFGESKIIFNSYTKLIC